MRLDAFKGITNTHDSHRLPDGILRECVDFAIHKTGLLKQCDGYSKKGTGQFSCIGGDDNRCFAVRNGDLVEAIESNGQYIFETLRAGVGQIVMDFCECDGSYYGVSDTINCVIDQLGVRNHGLVQVDRQPDITDVSGGVLLAGSYLVAVTALDEYGRESGTVEPKKYTLSTDNRALQLSNFSDTRDSNAAYYAIYVSTRDGEELFRQGVVATNTATTTIYDVSDSEHPLNTVAMFPAPRGQHIAYSGYGVLFIANRNVLYYSQKYGYDFFSPFWCYEYDSNITAIMPCESGLWVGTEKGLFWINGRIPKYYTDQESDFVQTKKHYAKIEPKSQRRINPEFLNSVSHGWMCASSAGLFLLLDGGQFKNVTQENIKLSKFDGCIGATVTADNDDCIRYLAIFNGANVPERSF